MKIINKSQSKIYYQVTPSGTVLSGSEVIASGIIDANNSLEFPLENAGKNPIVYVKDATSYNEGNLALKVKDGNSEVLLSMTEVEK
jgi:hypothetical protein